MTAEDLREFRQKMVVGECEKMLMKLTVKSPCFCDIFCMDGSGEQLITFLQDPDIFRCQMRPGKFHGQSMQFSHHAVV